MGLAKCAGLAELCALGLCQTVTGSPFPRPLPSWGCWLTLQPAGQHQHASQFWGQACCYFVLPMELSPSESSP